MGTNYYYIPKPPCECCGREYERIHIGKSSAGWCFSLNVIPEDNINDLNDWKVLWQVPESRIMNEYGEDISVQDMILIITDRKRKNPPTWSLSCYNQNYAQPGPNNLVRAKIDHHHCVGHGEGTWDLITGDFS